MLSCTHTRTHTYEHTHTHIHVHVHVQFMHSQTETILLIINVHAMISTQMYQLDIYTQNKLSDVYRHIPGKNI